LTKDGRFLAIDSTVSFDDNALIRHPDIVKWRDSGEEDPREVEASTHSLNYVSLDENIACLVNGAGLAMATRDLIMYYGSEPANFLGLRGGANEGQVIRVFDIFWKTQIFREYWLLFLEELWGVIW
jgi:succinyl-CoA synthetase beta subunit